MALTTSILKSDFFPPNDSWLSGEKVNYYYYGHFLTALLSKMSGINPEISYNLMLGTVYSFFAIGILSIILNLTKRKFWAFIGTILACFSANLSHFIFFINPANEPGAFHWWGPSRVIPNTINEFPFFSFLIGDLHAHFISLCILPLIIILFFSFAKKPTLLKSLFSGVVLAIIFMSNSWNFLIFFPVFVLSFWTTLQLEEEINSNVKNKITFFIKKNIIAIPLVLTSFFIIIYFILSAKGSPQEFALVKYETDLKYLLILFPLQFLVAIAFFYKNLIHKNKFALLSFILISLIGLIIFYFKISHIIHIFIIFILISFYLFLRSIKNETENKKDTQEKIVYLFFVISIMILIFCELFYLKDLFSGGEYQRLNTIFKLYYQFWILSSIWLIYFTYKIAQKNNWFAKIFLILFFSILIINVSYTYWGIRQSINLSKKPTLNGMGFIKEANPDEYASILWIKNNIQGQKNIAEKPGDSFTDDSPISTFTGNLTPLGWFGHEWTWRSNAIDKISNRRTDLDNLFSATDIEIAKSIVEKYKIDYIYLGKREKEKYKIKEDSIIYALGEIIFKEGESQLIKIH